MKLKTQIIINTGLYQDIRPEIEIDTENLQAAKELIWLLHKNFYGMLNGIKTIEQRPEDDINGLVDVLVEKARNGKASSLADYVKATENNPANATKINDAKKEFNRGQYASRKKNEI